MLLVQSTRVHDLASRRSHKVNLQVLLIQKPKRAVAIVIGIGKLRISRLAANGAQTLNITRATSNNIHGRLRVLHAIGISGTINNRRKSLRVVYMAENTEVNAVLVKQAFERLLAGTADV